MRNVLRAGQFALALMASAVLGACESADPVAGPLDPTQGRSFDAFEASVISEARANGIDPTAPAPELPVMQSGGSNGDFVFVQGSMGDESVEAVIGSAGGVLNLGNHWLMVPRNAVRGSVRFRMTPISDGALHVDLTATTVLRSGAATENDVGRTGFRNPVYLGFHFGDPTQIDPASLQVAWLANGTLVRQQTFLYEQEWAVGVLRHFSGYVLVGN